MFDEVFYWNETTKMWAFKIKGTQEEIAIYDVEVSKALG